MSAGGSSWGDLRTRLGTGLALGAVGIVTVSLGGIWFAGLAAVAVGVMLWELAQMVAPDRRAEAVQIGVLSGAAILIARAVGPVYAAPILIAPALVGMGLLRRHHLIFLAYAVAIAVAGWGLTVFRDTYGVTWLVWMILVVVVTDIAGYFGGRHWGGRKFWPSISPKKTWSGVVSGWAAAAMLGAVFLVITTAGRDLIWISMVISFASQMGDIAQSAVKRRMGVKDSSALLPGHGGLFDRFDALLGASLLMLLTALLVDVPEIRI